MPALLGGIVYLDAVLGRLDGELVRRLDGRVLIAVDDADHHALHVAELAVGFFEDGLGARHAAEIQIPDAAFDHGAQLLQRLVALGGLEADGLLNDRAQTLPGVLGRARIPAAHAAQLRVLALVLERELAAAERIVHHKAYRVDVRGGGELTVPVQLRRDKVQLLPRPGALPGGTEGDLALLAQADVLRVDAAPAASVPDLRDHGAAEVRNERAQRLLVHLRKFFPQSLIRFK